MPVVRFPSRGDNLREMAFKLYRKVGIPKSIADAAADEVAEIVRRHLEDDGRLELHLPDGVDPEHPGVAATVARYDEALDAVIQRNSAIIGLLCAEIAGLVLRAHLAEADLNQPKSRR